MSGILNVSQQNTTITVEGVQTKLQPAEGKPVELKAGDSIQGTVVSVAEENGEKYADISLGDNVIRAKLSEDMGLRQGQTLNFAVKSLSKNGVSLTPLFENTAVSLSTEKALNAAGIAITRDSVAMVESMMKSGLPINKDALRDMNNVVSSFQNASISTLVEMKSLDIPITENNISQYQNYKNYEHQVINEMQEFADELPQAFNALASEGKIDQALNLYKGIIDEFASTGSSSSLQNEAEESAVNVSPNIESSEKMSGEQTGVTANSSVDNVDKFVDKNDRGVISLDVARADEFTKNSEKMPFEDISKEDFVQKLNNLNISPKITERYLAASLNENTDVKFDGKELLKELSSMLSDTENMSDETKALFKDLFSHKEFGKILKNAIADDWLLKPFDVEKKDNVTSLYQKLGSQLKSMSDTITNTLGAESKLGSTVTNMQNNLDFMNQLNQIFQYVQLPLQMSGQEAHGDLYVYRNKNKRVSEDGSVSAVLHLDMDNLGPVDVFVKMKENKVSTNFYVMDESVLDLINDNIHILNERLEKRGYTMQVKMMLHDDKDEGDMAVNEMFDVNKMSVISTASFDARA
ncbi:flagellar hook-length control protein FliK [Butyrivibrio sp. AE2005]|uniref:flagellar hook-length control protein FliK n=1 Tax=Butyrivibrio sp. AE2005 TaxID=1496722 RepID=UPI00047B2DF6|nr:flagellar hook-length control protein FliK [Butyrivibrio sp. AE2005]